MSAIVDSLHEPGRTGTLGRWASDKNMIAGFITVILVLGEWQYGIVGGYSKLILVLGTCVATELLLGLLLVGRVVPLQSAYITGISLTLLLRPQGGLTWPFVVGAALSIGAKYAIRYKDRHLFNPSNLGLALLVLLAPSKVALLSHELGSDPRVNAVIWALGLLIVLRAGVIHITLTYVVSFVALAALRSAITGTALLTEISPITGPMYQLLCFFMMTDPRTTMSSRRGQMVTVVIVAIVESLFRLGNDFEWPWAAAFAPAPPILALFLVGPIAFAWDLRRSRPKAD